MGIAHKAAGTSFTRTASGLLVPDRAMRRHLMGAYVFGGSLAESVYNRADPSRPLTVIGVPVINAASATVRSHATAGFGFETQHLSSEDRTLVLVRKTPVNTASQMVFAGRKSTSAAVNTSAWALRQYQGANFSNSGEAGQNFTQGATRPRPTTSNFFFEAAVAVPRGLGLLYYYGDGSQHVATSGTPATLQRYATNNLTAAVTCLGGTGLTDTVANNSFEAAYLLEWNRALSAAEIEAVFQLVVADGARRGLTIV